MRKAFLLLLLAVVLLSGCVTTRRPAPGERGEMQGLASWYGQEFAGRTTANGEIFDPLLLTAAHRTLPFGTVVEVRNPKTGQSVKVRINDRGPFIGSRVIDLSYAAAEQVGLINAGVGYVELRVVKLGAGEREPPAPYVVNAGANAPKPSPTPVESAPPPVAFPLPPSASDPSPTVAASPDAAQSEGPFNVAVHQERAGSEARKQVSPDGRGIETVPTVEAAPPAPPATSQRPVPPQRVPEGSFVVQLGAFRDENNAQDLRQRASAVFERVSIDPNGQLYRVRVGPFPTRAAAIDAREKLENSGFSGIVMPAGD